MDEFIDNDAPLPSFEVFLVDSLEELEVFIDELLINGKFENLLFCICIRGLFIIEV